MSDRFTPPVETGREHRPRCQPRPQTRLLRRYCRYPYQEDAASALEGFQRIQSD
jgi:hypothetical protein